MAWGTEFSSTRASAIVRSSGLAVLALVLASCGVNADRDTPQASFDRWQRAAEARDIEAYFEEVNPPLRTAFLANVVASWRDGDWQTSGEGKHEALGALLEATGLIALQNPIDIPDRALVESLGSTPTVIASIFESVDGEGPRGVPMWDLLPQPIALGSVGAIDDYDSAAATATLLVFDIDSMRQEQQSTDLRFFRDREGRWRVAPPGF